jgi:hypothetical protein
MRERRQMPRAEGCQELCDRRSDRGARRLGISLADIDSEVWESPIATPHARGVR